MQFLRRAGLSGALSSLVGCGEVADRLLDRGQSEDGKLAV